MENNQAPSPWALTFLSLLACLFRWQFVCNGLGLSWCSSSCVSLTRVPMHCQRWTNKWPRACGREGQTLHTSSLTSASIFLLCNPITPPAVSQGLNIDNTVKSPWVVMSASISNNGPDSGQKPGLKSTDECPSSGWTAQQHTEKRSISRMRGTVWERETSRLYWMDRLKLGLTGHRLLWINRSKCNDFKQWGKWLRASSHVQRPGLSPGRCLMNVC